MPGPEYAGIATFYEDFPYAWWTEFRRLDELGDDALEALPDDVALVPQYADVSDQLERKITGIGLYASQINRLFGGEKQMAEAVRGHATQIGALGDIDGFAERYWASEPI